MGQTRHDPQSFPAENVQSGSNHESREWVILCRTTELEVFKNPKSYKSKKGRAVLDFKRLKRGL